MCIAIVQPAGKVISDEILLRCYQGNPHGGGMAWVENGKVVVRKGYFKFGEFKDKYDEITAGPGKDAAMLIHFRIATQGKVGVENCHPFYIKKGALIHNGSFPWAHGGTESDMSDTRELVGSIYNNMDFEDAKAAEPEISKIVGYNKIATLHDCGGFVIFNRQHWVENEGSYFSHGSPLRGRFTYTSNDGDE